MDRFGGLSVKGSELADLWALGCWEELRASERRLRSSNLGTSTFGHRER